jgi:polyribonucleotide 5'-hydroxyl-kinase
MDNDKKTDSREWELDAETEYRFEVDLGTSLAIKVRLKTLL